MRSSIAIAMVLCLFGGSTFGAEKTDGGRPNIVFLLIDDMGWPDVACYGHKFHETPRIDRFCAESVKFTDFYAATPVCSSTRSTIQTSQFLLSRAATPSSSRRRVSASTPRCARSSACCIAETA